MEDHERWLEMAKDDWTCIHNELNAENKPWAVIAFHSELASEKYLKGFLSFHRHKPEHTHDLNALLNVALGFDRSLEILREDCSDLATYAVDARYPGIPAQYNEQIGKAAVDAAKRICNAVRERLPDRSKIT